MDQVYRPLRHIAFRKIDEQMVLVDTKENRILSLNSSATAIWERLDGRRPVRQIAAEIEELFEVNREDATSDTLDFINYLEKRDFISYQVPDVVEQKP